MVFHKISDRIVGMIRQQSRRRRRQSRQQGGSAERTSRNSAFQQFGGGISVLQAQVGAIDKVLNELNQLTSSVQGSTTQLQQVIDDLINQAARSGRRKEIEADIRFYVDQQLRDNLSAEELFPENTAVPPEYVELITLLNQYASMRRNLDMLMKLIYQYVRLRIGYQVGATTESVAATPVIAGGFRGVATGYTGQGAYGPYGMAPTTAIGLQTGDYPQYTGNSGPILTRTTVGPNNLQLKKGRNGGNSNSVGEPSRQRQKGTRRLRRF